MKPFIVAAILGDNFEITHYRVVDIDTEKVYKIKENELMELIKKNPENFKDTNMYNLVMGNAANYTLHTNILEVKANQTICDKRIVLKKLNKDGKYLVSDCNGKLDILDEDEISDEEKFINIVTDDNDRLICLINVVIEPQEHKDTEKEREIRNKYESFITKCKLLGIDNSFEYRVEGKDVILTNYTGTSTKVIVPPFVTVLGENCFCAYDYNMVRGELEEVILNEGLERISRLSFGYTILEKLVIPSTVDIIERDAFYNSSLAYFDDETEKYLIDTNRVTIQSNGTIIEI